MKTSELKAFSWAQQYRRNIQEAGIFGQYKHPGELQLDFSKFTHSRFYMWLRYEIWI